MNRNDATRVDLLELRVLFDQASDCSAHEQEQLVRETREQNPALADQLEAMLREDLEATRTQVTDHSAAHVGEARSRSIDGYELLEEIGHGGMGVVYRARQRNPDRTVALKMIRLGRWASASEIQRFQLEINAIAKLEHPSIVPIYEIGEQDGEHYFTMQLVEGGRFDEYLDSATCRRREALQIFVQICAAVAHCHAFGIVHRDLKPSNVLLDEHRTPKVTDFGLAKQIQLDSDITNTGDFMGTPGFMAPEQASRTSGTVIDSRADVYSLGAMLYKLLTGNVPVAFEGCDLLTVVERIHTSDITLPRSIDRTIPHDLEAICMKCLERQPDNRYGNARQLQEDLQRFLDGDPVTAVPVTKTRRIYRWARRQPGLAVTCVAVATFYVYHLICVYGLSLYDLDIPLYRNFHVASTAVAFLWLASAAFFQWQLFRTRGANWPLLGWVTAEPILLTTLLWVAQASARSPLCSIYLILIAASVLRFRPLVVIYVTSICVVSYLALIWQSQSLDVAPITLTEYMPLLINMICLGIIQFFALRRSRFVVELLGDRL